MSHASCNHQNTTAANQMCESFRAPAAAPAPRTAPAAAPAATPAQIRSLTNKAIRAHRAYRAAKAANLNPIQSTREVRANRKYQDIKAELATACRLAGIATPTTWNL